MAMPTIVNGAPGSPLEYGVVSNYGIYDDDILRQLKSKVPRAQTFSWMRRLSGDRMIPKRIAKQHKISHFEDGEWFPGSVTIASPNTGTANQVTITLPAADHQDSGARSYPRVGMLAVFQNRAQGYVSAVNKDTPNAHTVTIYRLNTSQDVQAAAVAGQKVVFFSNANTGSSGSVEGHIPKFERVDNWIHTYREDLEVEDHEMQNNMYFDYKGQPLLYLKALDDTADRFSMQEDLSMLINEQAASLVGTDGKGRSKSIRTVKGLIPQIEAGGINFSYYGSPSLTTLENLELLYNKYYGDKENLLGQGIRVEQKWRTFLLQFTEGGDKNIKFDGRAKQDIGINFRSASIGAYVFHFDTWPILSHPGTLGADEFDYGDTIIAIPMGGGDVRTPNKDGGYDREYRKYFRMAYAKNPYPGVVEDVYQWQTGGMAPSNKTDVANREFHMVSWKTLELFCINKFAQIKKAA